MDKSDIVNAELDILCCEYESKWKKNVNIKRMVEMEWGKVKIRQASLAKGNKTPTATT
jgi:hypothetical protein